jgi:hypothetical protein
MLSDHPASAVAADLHSHSSVSDGVLTSWRNITVEVGPPPGPGPRPRYRDVTVSDDGWLLWLLLALAIVGTAAIVLYFRLRPE